VITAADDEAGSSVRTAMAQVTTHLSAVTRILIVERCCTHGTTTLQEADVPSEKFAVSVSVRPDTNAWPPP
jgi:hypothetical protein